LEDARVAVLLTRERLLDGDEAAEGPDADLPDETSPDNAAYVIYTSGSLGRPKGVLVRHGSLASYTVAAADEYGIGPGDRVLQFASASFDTSAEEIYPCLARGASLVLRDEPMTRSVAAFLDACRDRGITVLDLPTAFWHEITAGLEDGLEVPPAVRLVILGGERARPEMVELWRSRVGDRVRLVNTYGPTEATIVATQGTLSGEAEPGREVSIGRAVRGARTYVLDRGARPVPPGAPGELYVGGAGLARGYLDRPDLTAERFVPDPFGESGGRLYRTGDLVRFRLDGSLEFLGRADHQVKVRGFRVEPGEIETVLGRHPGLRQAVVLAREDTPGDRRLVAYVVAAPGQDAPTAAALRAFAQKSLPDYMVPAAFVPLPALPLTPSGKVARRALPAPDWTRRDPASASAAPRTAAEEMVAGVCAEVLGLARLGIHDNLFDLGCHSLLAMKIVARLREAFQVELPLLDVFETPTVAELAERVEHAEGAAAGTRLPPLGVAPRHGHLPLSFAQERIWFLHQLEPESVAYHVPRALRIRGPLSVPLLEEVFTEIVRRHEILRTTFPARDGRPLQVINGPWPMSIPVVDLRACPEAEREARLADFIVEHGRRPFDLERGPLMRFSVVRLDEQDYALVMTEHHFVHDGWTQGVLLKDFLALYAAFGRGEPSPLPPLPVQYADFAVWQRRWLQGEVLDRQLLWWRERLAGAPELLELPTDLPRPAVRTAGGDAIHCDIPLALANALRRLSRELGGTLFMTLTAAFDVLLWRYSGQEDFCLGTVTANRRLREVEGLLGMIVNTLVLRMDLGGDPTFQGLAERVRKVCLGAYEHQDMPIEKLVEALRPERSLGHTPLFQVMFSLLDTPTSDLELPGLELELMGSHNRSSKFDLNVTGIPHAEQRVGGTVNAEESEITLLIEYSTDLFRRDTVERLAGHYLALLEGAVADPGGRIAELPLLSREERAQILAWSVAPAAVRQDVCVHELVAAWAAETPAALAVAAGGEELSYGELVRRAGALAGRLRSLGAGPESRVAVFAGRTPDLFVGLLGVLASGAAYVPLDPSYPPERLAFLLDDAGAPVIVTQEHLLPLLPKTAALTVLLDGEEDDLPRGWALPENLAYVLYTSGSTGTPKGVEVSHASLMNLVDWHLATYGIAPSDRAAQVASLGFDAAVWEIWPYLAAGASLHLPDEETRTAPEKLQAWLAAAGIAIAFLPTPLAEVVLDLGG
ncbi:MAG TPA: amino acid adenylation domain-containing protein, partial [Thermoanaerobaculia bacterium]|nr:amino acid adenylation domain-containing protein [Thermoanaerobaculia bacterium]